MGTPNKKKMKGNGIKLERYKSEYDLSLSKFTLPSSQEQFTALPNVMLEKAKTDRSRHPIVILGEEEPVGFFVLRSGDEVLEFTKNPRALLLIALSINSSEQGKGYAKLGMSLLKDFVLRNYPNSDEVVLAVNSRNIPAQKLYEKVGFEDTGRRKMGRIGEQMIYELKINHKDYSKS
jgi:RimJ/RimL family protein N-acetyltransferase